MDTANVVTQNALNQDLVDAEVGQMCRHGASRVAHGPMIHLASQALLTVVRQL